MFRPTTIIISGRWIVSSTYGLRYATGASLERMTLGRRIHNTFVFISSGWRHVAYNGSIVFRARLFSLPQSRVGTQRVRACLNSTQARSAPSLLRCTLRKNSSIQGQSCVLADRRRKLESVVLAWCSYPRLLSAKRRQ